MQDNTNTEQLTKQELLIGAQRDLLRCEQKLRVAGFMALRPIRSTILLAIGEIEDVAKTTNQKPDARRTVTFTERVAG